VELEDAVLAAIEGVLAAFAADDTLQISTNAKRRRVFIMPRVSTT